jgi:hypothetical protein
MKYPVEAGELVKMVIAACYLVRKEDDENFAKGRKGERVEERKGKS